MTTRVSGNGTDGRADGEGFARSVRLFRAFRREQSDPAYFYSMLAEDTVAQLSRYCALRDSTVVDVGGGAGYFGRAVRQAGAAYYLVEPDPHELSGAGGVPTDTTGTVLGDGYWLPLRDGGVDVCFSSNVLEHVSDPDGLIDEMVRVTRPGGIIYVSFCNWYSPWGGHETSPWHFVGGEYAASRYLRRRGKAPKNRYGETLFPIHIGPTLRKARARTGVELIDALPRYYPRGFRALLRFPGLREIASWNLLLVFRRSER